MSLFPRRPVGRSKFRRGERARKISPEAGDGSSPTSGLQIGFPGSHPQVTQATLGGAPCWLKLPRWKSQAQGARHLHGRPGRGVVSLQ